MPSIRGRRRNVPRARAAGPVAPRVYTAIFPEITADIQSVSQQILALQTQMNQRFEELRDLIRQTQNNPGSKRKMKRVFKKQMTNFLDAMNVNVSSASEPEN